MEWNGIYFKCFVTVDMPMTQAELITQLNAWYTSKTSDPMAFRERAFVNTTGEILKANFKCATAKLNQIIFCKCKL